MMEEPHEGEHHPVVIHSPPEKSPEQAQFATTRPHEEMAKPVDKSTVWWQNAKPGAAFVLFLASLVLLIQTSIDCTPTDNCTKYYAWGLSCAVLSLTFSLFLFLLLARRGEAYDAKGAALYKVLVTLLFAIWIPGAGVLTFKSPYVLTGNAYFACWLGFVASGYLFAAFWNIKFPWEAFQDTPRVCLWCILLASVVELTQAAIDCPPDQDCTGRPAWALAVGIMSTVISFVTLVVYMLQPTLNKVVLKIVGLLLFAMWIPGAGILTFDGPYTVTGNAYFACWGAFLSSGYLFYICLFPQPEEVTPAQKVTVS
jgi:hypothetical protein